MASSPDIKVYSPQGDYVASCKYVTDAAILMSSYGKGACIKYTHRIVVWREGSESQPASESYDHVAETVQARIAEFNDSKGKVRSWK